MNAARSDTGGLNHFIERRQLRTSQGEQLSAEPQPHARQPCRKVDRADGRLEGREADAPAARLGSQIDPAGKKRSTGVDDERAVVEPELKAIGSKSLADHHADAVEIGGAQQNVT